MPGATVQNVATFTPVGGPPINATGTGITTVPLLPPIISFPANGEIAAGSLTVAGRAQPSLTIRLYENATTLVGTTTSGENGRFLFTFTSTRIGIDPMTELSAVAVGAGGVLSPSSAVITLMPTSGFFCPQRSSGARGGRPIVFRDSAGLYSASDFSTSIPDSGGGSSTTIAFSLAKCSGTNALPDNVKVFLENDIHTGTRVGNVETITFDWPHAKAWMTLDATCGATTGAPVRHYVKLIDPDGFVFDASLGFDATKPTEHVMAGVKVTAYVHVPEWGGWVVWPADMYNHQVNPQTTKADGYFAFFTPPGRYYLQADAPNGYQSWRSPVVTVVDDIVHVNVPLTPTGTGGVTRVSLSPDAITPSTLEVQPGALVEWTATLPATASAGDVLAQSQNPTLHAVVKDRNGTAIDSTNPAGFDSGMLTPGQAFRRQFALAGVYAYDDGAGHVGHIVVASPGAPTVASISPVRGSTVGGSPVRIAGTGFAAGVGVTFGGVPATGVVVASATAITAAIPAHTAGTVDVAVTNSDAQTATLAGGFTFVEGFPVFTDDPLRPRSTPVLALHLTELREWVQALRTRHSLAPASWAIPSIVGRSTIIRAVHVTELRTAIDEVFVAAGRLTPTYSSMAIVGRSSVVKAADLNELRAAIVEIW